MSQKQELLERLRNRRDLIEKSIRMIRNRLEHFDHVKEVLDEAIDVLEGEEHQLLVSAAALLGDSNTDEDLQAALRSTLRPSPPEESSGRTRHHRVFPSSARSSGADG